MSLSFQRLFSLRRLRTLITKEVIQMRRDRITFAMMIGVPLMQLMLFGFAINSDPKGLPAALVAPTQDRFTRAMVSALETTGYYRFTHVGLTAAEAEFLISRGDVSFVVTVPSDFGHRVLRGDHPQILIEADATDPSVASGAISTLGTVAADALLRETGGEAEARVPHRRDIEQDAAIPDRHLRLRPLAEQRDAVLKTRIGDAALQIGDEAGLLPRHQAGDDGGPVRVLRQQADHRLDEKIGALLMAHPAEDADAVTAGQAALRPGGVAVGGGLELLRIDAVMDDVDRHVDIDEGGRVFRRRDDRVHAAHQPAREAGALPLRGAGEEELPFLPQHMAQDEADQHLVVAPRVPDAVRAPARRARPAPGQQLEHADARHVGRQVRADAGDGERLRLFGHHGDDRGRAARIAIMQIGGDSLDPPQVGLGHGAVRPEIRRT
jgi:hypothetical protein